MTKTISKVLLQALITLCIFTTHF